MAATAERRQRRQQTMSAAKAASAVVVAGALMCAYNVIDPFGTVPEETVNGINAPAVLDAQGRDVAEDCVTVIEASTGQAVEHLSRESIEEYAAGCALLTLVGPSEVVVQQIADRMQAFGGNDPQDATMVVRGTAAPQIP
jgi:hypothetical protein